MFSKGSVAHNCKGRADVWIRVAQTRKNALRSDSDREIEPSLAEQLLRLRDKSKVFSLTDFPICPHAICFVRTPMTETIVRLVHTWTAACVYMLLVMLLPGCEAADTLSGNTCVSDGDIINIFGPPKYSPTKVRSAFWAVGRVSDTQGNPIPDTEVTIRRWGHGKTVAVATTNREGRYRFCGVQQNVSYCAEDESPPTYYLTVSNSCYSFSNRESSIELPASATSDQFPGCELESRGNRKFLTWQTLNFTGSDQGASGCGCGGATTVNSSFWAVGRVSDRQGNPIPDTEVSIKQAGSNKTVAVTTTDSAGRYAFCGVQHDVSYCTEDDSPPRYYMTASAACYSFNTGAFSMELPTSATDDQLPGCQLESRGNREFRTWRNLNFTGSDQEGSGCGGQ